jgi:hypothetical protein
MPKNTENTHQSRRGFFKSLFGDIVPKSKVETENQRIAKQRASILALKYGKNEARLAKIGVKSPVYVENMTFRVDLTGVDATGDAHNLQLVVDTKSDDVTHFEPEPQETNPS